MNARAVLEMNKKIEDLREEFRQQVKAKDTNEPREVFSRGRRDDLCPMDMPKEERDDTSVLMVPIDADTTAFNEKIDALMEKLREMHALWQELNKGDFDGK